MPELALLPRQENQRVALRGVRFTTHLSGMTNKTVVEQTFVNQESVAIEAVYTFPLPPSAAVCHFEVITEDRVLTGRVKEREEAWEDYDNAIGRGDGAFMAQQIRPDVFSVMVGNIKPRHAATIRLTYVAPVQLIDGTIRLAFPTTIAPRYATDSGTDPITAMLDADALNPPSWLDVPYGLTVAIDVALGSPMRSITSPSHELNVEQSEAGQDRISLAGGLTEMDRDLIINLEPERDNEPRVQVGTGPDGAKYVALTFIPEFGEPLLAEPQPHETVFLLDCSGSMQGESISRAKQALELCLNSLSEGDFFNIYRFGSTYEVMEAEPVPYNDQTWKRARRYVASIQANLGGTEILEPLSQVLAPHPGVGTCRQVIVLTDGQVSNEPAVIDAARNNAHHNRIFTIGIGPASSAHLVNGLAHATGGMAEFVTYGERVEDKVLRTFSRIASPALSNVVLDWGGVEAELPDSRIPPVFDGDAMRVVGRVPGELPSEVTLRCDTTQGSASWTLQVPTAQADHELVAYQWARETLATCEDHAAHRTRDKLIQISQQFNLLCPFTAFVAIEHRTAEQRNAGQPALREVPVMLATGWGGKHRMLLRHSSGGAVAYAAEHVDAQFQSAPKGFGVLRKSRSTRSLFGAIFDSGDAAPETQPAPDSDLMALLRLQDSRGSFSGIFDRSDIPQRIRGRLDLIGDLQAKIRDRFESVGDAEDPDVTATVAALSILFADFADDRAIWRRAGDKAIRFVAGRLSVSARQIRRFVKELSQTLGS